MSLYSILVFLHIVGALGFFAGIGLEQVGLFNLRRASSSAQLRDWLGVLSALRRVDAPSGLTILATGVSMVAARWGTQAWIGVSLLAMVLMAVLGIAVTGRRAAALAKALPAGDGPIPSSLREPVMRVSASLRAALALGVVFLMCVKPGTAGALAAIGVALGLGAVVAAAAARRSASPLAARAHSQA